MRRSNLVSPALYKGEQDGASCQSGSVCGAGSLEGSVSRWSQESGRVGESEGAGSLEGSKSRVEFESLKEQTVWRGRV